MSIEEILTIKELADALKKDRSTIWRWSQRADFIKPIKTGENSVGYLKSEFEAWMEEKKAARS